MAHLSKSISSSDTEGYFTAPGQQPDPALPSNSRLSSDIKWHNFAVGLPPKDTTIYMLDFGIARPYREKNGNVR